MDGALEAVIIEALDRLEAGESVGAILRRYPEHAGELRPILETTQRLEQARAGYRVSARSASRAAFLERAATLREQPRAWSLLGFLGASRRLAGALGVVAAVLLLAALVVAPAQSAVPGDALYVVKQAVEGARLALTVDPAAEAALREQLRRERLAEIAALLAAGREAEVECAGTIEAVAGNTVLLDGLRLTLTEESQIEGSLVEGAMVRGLCAVEDGQVLVRRLTVEAAPDDEPSPTPTPTVTAEPTSTVEPSATPTPTAPAASATPEALAPPTASATPDEPPPPAVDDDGEAEDEEDEGSEEDRSGSNGGSDDDGADDAEEPPEEEGSPEDPEDPPDDDGSDDDDSDDDDSDDGRDDDGSDDDD